MLQGGQQSHHNNLNCIQCKHRLHTEIVVRGGIRSVETEPRCVTNLYHGL